MLIRFQETSEIPGHDLCVIGSGPVGIAVARQAATEGLSVLLIESGEAAPNSFGPQLSRAAKWNEAVHSPMEIVSCRALGGTSWWWGGVCVPFDESNFIARPYAPGTDWPLTFEKAKLWYPGAAAFLGCGTANFTSSNEFWTGLRDASFDTLERRSARNNIGHVWMHTLRRSTRILILLGATATELHPDQDHTRIIAITLTSSTKTTKLAVQRCVLACGGLETTRLLLATQRKYPLAFDRAGKVLGKFYMGHISGKIADVVFDNPSRIDDCDFFLDGQHFVRRRFTINPDVRENEKILDIAFWIDNPSFHDPAHRSGMLSLIWLALAVPLVRRRFLSHGMKIVHAHAGREPFRYGSHILNIIASPVSSAAAFFKVVYNRYWRRPPRPIFLVRNRAGRYALYYHAEQLPSASSSVSLSDKTDPLGMPRLVIDFHYSVGDLRSVLRAHEILDRALRSSGLGRLEYRVTEGNRFGSVMRQASDGFHQLGTTRMSKDSSAGFVDENCKVHGIENLFIAGSSVFPSSGAANPTFLAVALACRLGSHLAAYPDNDRRHGSSGLEEK